MSRGEGERIKREEGKRFLLLADQRCVEWVLPLLKVALNSLTFYSNIGYRLLLLPLLIYVGFDGYSSFLYPWVIFIPSASPSLEDWQENRHRKRRWCPVVSPALGSVQETISKLCSSHFFPNLKKLLSDSSQSCWWVPCNGSEERERNGWSGE